MRVDWVDVCAGPAVAGVVAVADGATVFVAVRRGGRSVGVDVRVGLAVGVRVPVDVRGGVRVIVGDAVRVGSGVLHLPAEPAWKMACDLLRLSARSKSSTSSIAP